MKTLELRREAIEMWFEQLRPKLLQGNVRQMDLFANAGRWAVRLDGARLTAILEVELHAQGEGHTLWAHLSVGNVTGKRVPTWEELGWCKRYFLADRKAIQVLPPAAEYVNENAYVLHLFVPLDADPLPDFRHRRSSDGVVSL